MDTIKIKKINENAIVPTKQTANSAGYDLYASEDVSIAAHKYAAVGTGISVEMPNNIEGQVRPRSGLAFKFGITVLNAPGTIDADYRGEIRVCLINHSDTDYDVHAGDRIAQIVFAAVAPTVLTEVTQLGATERGEGGFGSTGK
ncbi:MAG: dUTP diphosphatase [Spirochaetales bacterium]|nr:dUTP diphosphatase [Spirochaetales bacterium]